MAVSLSVRPCMPDITAFKQKSLERRQTRVADGERRGTKKRRENEKARE